MSVSPAAITSFQNDWSKTVAYAQSKGIPQKAYLPVYQADSQNLLQYGNPKYSQAERILAVGSAAGLAPTTSIPSDNPSPTAVFSNVRSNLASIVIGLDPLRMVPNIWDTVTNTFEHLEQQILQPLEDYVKANTSMPGSKEHTQAVNDFSNVVLAPHSPWAFVPGVFDAAHAYQGKQGFRYLADNPITAILDIAPIGKFASTTLAHTASGAIIADRLGIAVGELKDLTPGQIAFRLGKTIPTNALNTIANPDAGEVSAVTMSVGDRWNAFRNHFGAGTDMAGLAKDAAVKDIEKTSINTELNQGWVNPLVELLKTDPSGKLATDAIMYLRTEYKQTDFRPLSEIVTDPRFTPLQGQVIENLVQTQDKINETELNAGHIVNVKTEFGVETYLAGDTRSTSIIKASDKMNGAYEALTVGAESFDKVLQTSDAVDYLVGQQIPRLTALTSSVYEHVKASIGDPQVADTPIADKLREVLPTSQRWDRTRPSTTDRRNLQTFLGLDEGKVLTTRRGTIDAPPFSGTRGEWSDAEREAWYDARRTLEANAHPDDPPVTHARIKQQAIDRLKILGQTTETSVHGTIPAAAATLLQDIAGPHGLAAQAIDAYNGQRWQELQQVTSKLHSKLSRKTLMSPTRSPLLMQFQSDMEALYKYSQQRQKISAQLISMYYGEKFKVDPETGQLVPGGRKSVIATGQFAKRNSIQRLMQNYEHANKLFHEASVTHPPPIWDSLFQKEYTRLWIEHEAGKAAADAAVQKLREEGYTDKQVENLRSDPQTLRELILMASKASLENPAFENISKGESIAIAREAYQTIANLRAAGHTPFFSTTINSFDKVGQTKDPLYNVSIGKDRLSKPSSLREKSQDISARSDPNTVYNFAAAMLKETTEYLKAQGEMEFQNESVKPFLFERGALFDHFRNYYADKIAHENPTGEPGRTLDLYQQFATERNLVAYDPKAIFSTVAPRFDTNEYYIDADISKALTSQFKSTTNPAFKSLDKATSIFRESILGYSPRYTLHITVGGTMLVLYRANLSMGKVLADAARIAWTKKIPDDIAAKYSLDAKAINEIERHNSTQEGAAETLYNHALGYSAGQFVIQEWIAKRFGKEAADLRHPEFWHNLLHVLPSINYRFTRYVTNMQRATVFLDGVARAHETGTFYDDVVKPDGTISREKIDMTPDQAIHEGMKAVDKVMGDVLAMTPIEREFLTRAMPFWSWTKHILKYVMTFPADHPYRAMFLSQQSRIIQDQNGTGLPIRTELMFFLGSMSPTGQQTAFDARAANPLRDTANYLTLGGWISALNPVVTAPLTYINPNITFGTNVLYPTVQYNQLYGDNQAVASGSFWNAAEQVVPELTAADAALNLSGQYNYLHATGKRNELANKIYSALNVSFLQEQSINLRQISATQEIDRYKQAEAASSAAWSSGDFSQLSGYATVPDPRNSQWEITPANLEKLYKGYQAQSTATGLPPAALATGVANPGY